MNEQYPYKNIDFEKKIRSYRKYLMKGIYDDVSLFASEEIEELIEYCEELGRHRDAFSLAQLLILIDKSNADFWNKRGTILLNLEEYKFAIRSFNNALKFDANHTESIIHKAICYSRLGFNRKAFRYILKAQRIEPDNPEVIFNKGLILENARKYARAVDVFITLINNLEYKKEVLQEIAFCYHHSSFYQNSLKCYDTLLEIDPFNYMYWYNKSLVYMDMNQFNNAIDSLETSTVINDKFFLAWHNKGIIFAKMGKLGESIESFKTALDIQPDDVDTIYNIASVYGDMGNYKSAIEFFTKAIKLDPRHQMSYFGRGVCFDALENYQSAIRDYDSALRINQQIYDIWYAKADCLYNENHLDDAIKCYKKALEIEPSNIDCLLDYGLVELELQHTEDAKNAFTKITQLAPAWAEGYLSLAKVHLVEKDYDAAKSLIDKAMHLDPKIRPEQLNEDGTFSDDN